MCTCWTLSCLFFFLYETLISDSNYCAARILRAIRIAARLGFRISKETADSIKNLSYSIVRLDKVVQEHFDLIISLAFKLNYSFSTSSYFREGSSWKWITWWHMVLLRLLSDYYGNLDFWNYFYLSRCVLFKFKIRFLLVNTYYRFQYIFILQAAYFVRHGFRRRDKRSNMLLVIVISSSFIYLLHC